MKAIKDHTLHHWMIKSLIGPLIRPLIGPKLEPWIRLSQRPLKYGYGFFKTISLIRCEFKLDSRIVIERRMVSNQRSTTCLCCCEGSQSFTQLILHCKVLKEAKAQHLLFLDKLYVWLTRIINHSRIQKWLQR